MVRHPRRCGHLQWGTRRAGARIGPRSGRVAMERIECARNGAGWGGAGARERDAIVCRWEIIAPERDTSARRVNSRLVRVRPRSPPTTSPSRPPNRRCPRMSTHDLRSDDLARWFSVALDLSPRPPSSASPPSRHNHVAPRPDQRRIAGRRMRGVGYGTNPPATEAIPGSTASCPRFSRVQPTPAGALAPQLPHWCENRLRQRLIPVDLLEIRSIFVKSDGVREKPRPAPPRLTTTNTHSPSPSAAHCSTAAAPRTKTRSAAPRCSG
jgi:hypothetical protein